MIKTVTSIFAGVVQPQAAVQRLPDILSVFLITGITYTLATITWGLLPQTTQSNVEPTSVLSTQPITKSSNSAQLTRTISNSYLFGKPNKKSQPITTKAPETKLNLILKGVLAASPMSFSIAIIARKKNGPEDNYAVGDKLPGNVLIKEIHADHVIIERGGRLETLRMPKDSGANNIKLTSRNSSANSNTGTFKEIRQQILKDPTSFANYALPIAVKKNGKQIGYRLSFQKKGDVLKAAGLRPTDIVTSVNGMPLNTPQNSIRALRKLRTSTQLNLIVSRNGSDVNINLQLQ